LPDYHQIGERKSIKSDRARKAKLPGARRSKEFPFRRYTERRRNRSDGRFSRL
jgi:hypothetical protein